MAIEYRTSRVRPRPIAEGSDGIGRGGRYGEGYSLSLYGGKQCLSEEGSYFIATNPTFGTAVATTTSITTYVETAGAVGAMMMLKNTEQVSSDFPKRIYMDYIKLMIVQVPTSATSWQYGLVLDRARNRYTSGGAVVTPTNPNGDASAKSIGILYFGDLTTAVPLDRRLVGRGTHRGVIPTTFDEYLIIFGGSEGGSGFVGAAAAARNVDITSPIIIGPQQQLCMFQWGTSNAAAPSYEFEIGWWER